MMKIEEAQDYNYVLERIPRRRGRWYLMTRPWFPEKLGISFPQLALTLQARFIKVAPFSSKVMYAGKGAVHVGKLLMAPRADGYTGRVLFFVQVVWQEVFRTIFHRIIRCNWRHNHSLSQMLESEHSQRLHFYFHAIVSCITCVPHRNGKLFFVKLRYND